MLPPYSNETTSKDAAVSMIDSAASIREKVFALLRNHGPMIDEEMYSMYATVYNEVLPQNTLRPRRWELVRDARLKDSGRKGLTLSKRKAIVWEVEDD